MNKLLKSTLSLALALMLAFSLGTSAFAETYYIENGSIEVNATTGGAQSVSQGGASYTQTSETIITSNGSSTAANPSSNTITINAGENATANVTIKDVHIDTSSVTGGTAAISVTGTGSTDIELDGSNSVKSASDHAGIEKNGGSTGTLTIKDDNKTSGSLTATGGSGAAGIGGGKNSEGSNIKITGGEVTANVHDGRYGGGAGIGGGSDEKGSDITISGGKVTANGGNGAAGIGGGYQGNGENIKISGGEVNATGGASLGLNNATGAGIGGGKGCDGTNITISGGTVTANGGSVAGYPGNYYVANGGAGIGGGGTSGNADKVTISGGTVNATGGYGAAGIGGGASGYSYDDPGKCGDVTISGKANVTATAGGAYIADDKTVFNAGAPIGSGGGIENKTAEPTEPDTSKLDKDNGKLEQIIPVAPEPTKPSDDTSGKGNPASSVSSNGVSAATNCSAIARYYVTKGDEQTWLTDSTEGLCFTLNSDDVIKVLIDGEEVEFKLNENGEIEISAEALQALEAGEHEIEFIFADGSCKALFTVK